jgi:hypothetical protein
MGYTYAALMIVSSFSVRRRKQSISTLDLAILATSLDNQNPRKRPVAIALAAEAGVTAHQRA